MRSVAIVVGLLCGVFTVIGRFRMVRPKQRHGSFLRRNWEVVGAMTCVVMLVPLLILSR